MFKVSPLRKRQFIGGIIGVILGTSVFYFLTMDSSEKYVSLGPMNTGHSDLSCISCHADARGNLSQQLQSNMQFAVGMREHSTDFGSKDVDVNNCLQCHDRPNDRHPTDRFSEPKFKEAIKAINAVTCITCHSEHQGQRVTISKINYCVNCHSDLEVEEDPLDISHVQLIKDEQWDTCLQCHDFHENHKYKVPNLLKDTIPTNAIRLYMEGGKDPYGTDKKYVGLTEIAWLEKYLKK